MLLTGILLVFLVRSSFTFKCKVCMEEPFYTLQNKCPICKDQSNEQTCFLLVPKCDPLSKYRNINGSCNHLEDPQMGMYDSTFRRILPSHYSDKKKALRLGSNRKPLPLARLIRTTLYPDANHFDSLTFSGMAWGHLLAHDMGLSLPIDSPVHCCKPIPTRNDTICLPAIIPPDDYFYPSRNITCLSLHRTEYTLTGACNPNQSIEQKNSQTHAIDISITYGAFKNNSDPLRTFKGGQLRVQTNPSGCTFPPNVARDQVLSICNAKSAEEPCFLAGDTRANQAADISTFQTIFLREHNRLAEALQKMHPEWDDETVFQEARAILIGIVQHISYKEFLVLYLGEENMLKFDLFPKSSGFTQYKSSINFATTNDFIAAAYRFGHSAVPGHLKMYDNNRNFESQAYLSYTFERPLLVFTDNNAQKLMMGFTIEHMQVFDSYYTTQLTDVDANPFYPSIQDLLTVDIMRGRDHGLAPYVYYLEICNGYGAQTFQSLTKFIPKKYIKKLKQLYSSVRDIDFIVGGNLERKVPGTRFGPTFLCILTEQFYRKKWGDRFWYEVGGQPGSFTKEQLQEIRKASLSRLFCDNSFNITEITVNSFLPASLRNKIVPCSSLPEINLTMWK